MTLAWKWQLPFFKRHGETLERACIIQSIGLMTTNNGFWDQDLHRMILLGCVAYWLVVIFMMVRREDQLTKTDLTLLKWGIFPMILVACWLVGFMMRYKH